MNEIYITIPRNYIFITTAIQIFYSMGYKWRDTEYLNNNRYTGGFDWDLWSPEQMVVFKKPPAYLFILNINDGIIICADRHEPGDILHFEEELTQIPQYQRK